MIFYLDRYEAAISMLSCLVFDRSLLLLWWRRGEWAYQECLLSRVIFVIDFIFLLLANVSLVLWRVEGAHRKCLTLGTSTETTAVQKGNLSLLNLFLLTYFFFLFSNPLLNIFRRF